MQFYLFVLLVFISASLNDNAYLPARKSAEVNSKCLVVGESLAAFSWDIQRCAAAETGFNGYAHSGPCGGSLKSLTEI